MSHCFVCMFVKNVLKNKCCLVFCMAQIRYFLPSENGLNTVPNVIYVYIIHTEVTPVDNSMGNFVIRCISFHSVKCNLILFQIFGAPSIGTVFFRMLFLLLLFHTHYMFRPLRAIFRQNNTS
jgi:hypothetical protein